MYSMKTPTHQQKETSEDLLFFTIFLRFHLIVLEFAPTAFTSAFWGHGFPTTQTNGVTVVAGGQE